LVGVTLTVGGSGVPRSSSPSLFFPELEQLGVTCDELAAVTKKTASAEHHSGTAYNAPSDGGAPGGEPGSVPRSRPGPDAPGFPMTAAEQYAQVTGFKHQ
jgi:hypothetical protein